jgi:hypothetical protein
MIIENSLNLPQGLVNAVNIEKHNAPGSLSATTLLKGVKEIILTDRHWNELSVDVADLFPAILGTAVHSLLEHEGENDFTEEVISYKVGEITITGRIDNYNMATGTICDYKTASVKKVKYKEFKDWYLQGMIYAWLLGHNQFPAESCKFIALLKDHNKTEAARDYLYPNKPVCVYEFPVTAKGLFETGVFIRSRVSDYEKYLDVADDDIPSCDPDERWDKPTMYAVMKQGRKTAVRVLGEEEAAAEMAGELGNGHYVEKRPGESTKCQKFCVCCKFCHYYKESVMGSSGTGMEPAAAQTAA